VEALLRVEVLMRSHPEHPNDRVRFMNQFGCPYSKDPNSRNAGTGGPDDGTFPNLVTGGVETRSNGGNIKDENIDRTSNSPGTLSMANTGEKNSGGSQLFLVRCPP
jgi:cyclophilin family peptidyl-prolyl cis-trans isomerase